MIISVTKRMEIPKDKALDSSLSLLREGYRFIPNRRRKLHSDIFEIIVMGQKAISISGPEAAEIFYDEENFRRHGAVPKRIRKSIFGERGVQTLDGDAHTHRKSLFMSLFTEERMNALEELVTSEWERVIPSWGTMDQVNFFQETKQVMCKIACQWVGVPLQEKEGQKRANDFWSLVDSFGAVGTRHWQGRIARKRCEQWIGKQIQQVRQQRLAGKGGTPLYEIAWHQDLHGKLLDEKVAAVEVINLIRPIVAISLFVLFGALAIYTFPEEKQKLQSGDKERFRIFTQEVRRYYPFTPFTGARVRNKFVWNGHVFKSDTLVFLDVYGMNHDYRIWESPSEFRPERFKNNERSEFTFIPQGGGKFIHNHRCAGELVTIIVMEKSFEFLTKKITYDVVPQDYHIDLTRMPPMPANELVIKGVTEIM